jgi:hypothetical protein
MTSYLHVVTLLIASAAALAMIVAVWAAESRCHWFLRAAAIWACVAVLLPIRAYEPAMVFAVSLPLIVLTIRAIQWLAEHKIAGLLAIRSSARLFRFNLRDLLLVIGLLGLSLAVVLHLHRCLTSEDNWLRAKSVSQIFTPGGILAVISLLAWNLTRARGKWPIFVGLAVTVVACSTELPGYADWLYALDDDFGPLSMVPSRDELAYRVAMIGLSVFAALASALCWLFADGFPGSPVRRFSGWCAVGILCVPLTVIYCWMLTFTPFPPGRTLSLGENRIIEIAQRMRIINEDSLPTNELEATDPLVAAEVRSLYAELLPLLENIQGLVPDLSLQSNEQLRKHVDGEEATTIRVIARALSAESKTAALQGDVQRSCAFAMTSIRLGAGYCHDAILISDLVGRVTTMYGYRNLTTIRNELDRATAKQVMADLQSIDAAEQPPATLIQRDLAYCERVYGWQSRLSNVIASIVEGEPAYWKNFAANTKGNHTWRATNRLFQAEFAIRVFKQERGRLPRVLEELVPDYLPSPLLDPFTGQPLVYRQDGDTYLLYSVGRDGIDDGGNFAKQSDYQSDFVTNENRRKHGRGYDLDLDMFVRQ